MSRTTRTSSRRRPAPSSASSWSSTPAALASRTSRCACSSASSRSCPSPTCTTRSSSAARVCSTRRGRCTRAGSSSSRSCPSRSRTWLASWTASTRPARCSRWRTPRRCPTFTAAPAPPFRARRSTGTPRRAWRASTRPPSARARSWAHTCGARSCRTARRSRAGPSEVPRRRRPTTSGASAAGGRALLARAQTQCIVVRRAGRLHLAQLPRGLQLTTLCQHRTRCGLVRSGGIMMTLHFVVY
mmetsp:Transcript_7340/g.24244  ORF Transcript_7340/g.24244 Transcript_7340/m.24244 type:complete len:243 (+) Transcript_7340:1343-2071(+)